MAGRTAHDFFGGAWHSVAGIEGRHQLPGLVQAADLLGAAQVPAVREHLREQRRQVAASVIAERDAELAFERRVHGQIEAEHPERGRPQRDGVSRHLHAARPPLRHGRSRILPARPS